MNALQNIPEHQKPEFMRSLETMQMKDSLKMYNNLVEQCFAHCVAARDGVSFERARRTAAGLSARAPRDARDLSENRTPARRAGPPETRTPPPQSFRSKALDKKEDECICRCAEKYIKLTQRVGFRFAEHQAAQGAAPSP